MYIIVVGGGKVGYYLAKELVEEGNEVLIIEKDAAKSERIAEELGDISLRGDGCEASTMEMAGFGRADMVIAVTGDDEDNLVSCQVAKAKFNVPRTGARLPQQSLIVLIIDTDGSPRVPSPDTIIRVGDEVVAVTATATEDALRAALGGAAPYGPVRA